MQVSIIIIGLRLLEKFEEERRLVLERANQEEKVFDLEVGGIQNLWEWKSDVLEPSIELYIGWRETEDGTREKVGYHFGYGWLNDAEWNEWSERKRQYLALMENTP